ncbi:MAG: hypothetical protein HY646_16605 [Acidobacteria bacterium]|nr:hypothetical protein [Acidobacteriota bacterium]
MALKPERGPQTHGPETATNLAQIEAMEGDHKGHSENAVLRAGALEGVHNQAVMLSRHCRR